MTRVATAASNELILTYVMEIQKRLQETHRQIASEQRYHSYKGLGLESNRAVNFENELRTAERFLQNNAVADTRLMAAEDAVEGIRKTVGDFRAQLNSYAMGEPIDDTETRAVQQFAFQAMKDLEAYLNIQFNGDFVFAGGRTSRQPVEIPYGTLAEFQADYDGDNTDDSGTDDAAAGDPTVFSAGVLDAWLNDDGLEIMHRTDIDQEVQVGIPASHAGFKKALEAFSTIAQGPVGTTGALNYQDPSTTPPVDNLQRVDDAMKLLDEALAEIEAVQYTITTSRMAIQQKNEKHESYLAFLKDRLSELQNVDVAEAVTRLMDDSRALEAAFNSLTKVRELSLMNYT